MGKRGGFKKGGGGRGGGRGRGGGGDQGPRRDNRTDKASIVRRNEKFEDYYNSLGIVPNEEKEEFWAAMQRDLPNSFRFTGSKGHALAVQQRLKDYYIPEITSITFDGAYVEAPKPVEWYPDQLAWYMTTPKQIIRRFAPFKSFQTFLVAETDVGNITRQEIVSMIPPLCMDVKPWHTVLDLCAAPGSKSAQLIEMLHAGEEDRARKVASACSTGSEHPNQASLPLFPGPEFADDGRSTGLLIANDVDYKRAHMLVHQVKRLSSPNIIVTNHDATIFPSIKIPPLPGQQQSNRYLKFDRILADVPCSGDGTARKNVEIWQKWSPANGLGLHATQIRILVRALQMLKVGGRVVYSTCSMNPVEDEAVVATAVARCGGADVVEIIETKDYLPGLQRYPGLKEWSIMDKTGRIWKDYDSVVKQKADTGDEGLGRLQESMFPPKNVDLPLNRAIRVYPHQQDTGAFFICILEKKSEIRAGSGSGSGNNVASSAVTQENKASNGVAEKADEAQSNGAEVESSGPLKHDRDDDEDGPDAKRTKIDEETQATDATVDAATNTTATATTPIPTTTPTTVTVKANTAPAPAPAPAPARERPRRDQPFEEPFKYLAADNEALERIFQFYSISPRFPRDRFLVRNSQGTATKNIYYTTALARDILRENEGKGMKFVHAGVKMFVKQDVPNPEVCPWRIQTDGLRLIETWVGPERIVKLWNKSTLRKLLIEMFPRFHGEAYKELGEVGEQVKDLGMGCCVLVVEPGKGEGEEQEGLSERMVFPLWKSVQSLNLMLPKEERKAMLLRLFNDQSDLVNLQQNPGGIRRPKESQTESSTVTSTESKEAQTLQTLGKEDQPGPSESAEDAAAGPEPEPEPEPEVEQRRNSSSEEST